MVRLHVNIILKASWAPVHLAPVYLIDAWPPLLDCFKRFCRNGTLGIVERLFAHLTTFLAFLDRFTARWYIATVLSWQTKHRTVLYANLLHWLILLTCHPPGLWLLIAWQHNLSLAFSVMRGLDRQIFLDMLKIRRILGKHHPNCHGLGTIVGGTASVGMSCVFLVLINHPGANKWGK